MKWTTVIMVFLMLMCIPAVYAVPSVTIDVPASFGEGDTVWFDYTMIASEKETVRFVPYVYCEEGPLGLLEEERIEVLPGSPYYGTFTGFKIENNVDPTSCHATIEIRKPVHVTFSEPFEIRTLPRLKPHVIRSLIRHNIIQIGDSLSPAPVPVEARVIYPDGKLVLQGKPLSASYEKPGTYEVEIHAKIPGFRPISVKRNFVVQEKTQEIMPSSSVAAKKAEVIAVSRTMSSIRGSGVVKDLEPAGKTRAVE